MLRSAAGLRPVRWVQQLKRPLVLPKYGQPTLRRALAYPKEGVFQQNSPPREQTYPQYLQGGDGSSQLPPRFPAQQPPPYNPQHYQPPPQYFGQPPPPPPEPPRRSRFIPRWTTVVSALLFTYIGITFVHSTLDVFGAVEPGTEEDEDELALLSEDFDKLLLVQQLRGAHRVVGGQSKPVYQEWTAYEGLKEPYRRRQRFTTGPLAGSAGVAAQRVFWDEEAGVLFLFINFGPATSGWPNVVHGGAIATIADEALGRVAVRRTKVRTAVTARLEMKYVATVEPGQWFVLVAAMDTARRSTDTKKYVQGKLVCCSPVAPSLVPDTTLLGDLHVHAEAHALFVVPKDISLPPIADDF